MNTESEAESLEPNESYYSYNESVVDEENSEPLGRDPLYIVLPITVIYGTIFLTGIIGNISTCVVIARNKHMHTATNYYLFSLAISDLLLLLSGLPPEMYVMWRKHSYVFGETFCILQSFSAETSANATVLTITAFTVERYVAICHPFQSHTLSKLSRAVKFVVAIWLLALGLAIPQAIQYGIVVQLMSSSSIPATYCTIKKILIENAFIISTCVFFVIPMTIITVLYILIGVKLRRSRLITVKRPTVNERNMDVSRHRSSSAQSHVIKMLVAVVVAFFICWAPFHAQRLMAMYFRSNLKPSNTVFIVYDFLTYISGVMYYLSTTINPLLYHIMSHKFREAFKSTLAQILGRKKRKSGGKNNSYISLTKNNHRLAYCNHNGRNVVSVHGFNNSSQRLPVHDNEHEGIQEVGEATTKIHRHLSLPNPKPVESGAILVTNPAGQDPKIMRITRLQKEFSRSRGSSDGSDLTLVTSLGRAEEGGENILLQSQDAGICSQNSPIKETDVDASDSSGLRRVFHHKRKPKCVCLNCDKKKSGIASLTKKCLFKSRSQTPTLEIIAKKIRFLPTRNRFGRDWERKDSSTRSSNKSKLSKTNSFNTISNSSLQDLDESEFTSSELAEIMGQLKNGENATD